MPTPQRRPTWPPLTVPVCQTGGAGRMCLLLNAHPTCRGGSHLVLLRCLSHALTLALAAVCLYAFSITPPSGPLTSYSVYPGAFSTARLCPHRSGSVVMLAPGGSPEAQTPIAYGYSEMQVRPASRPRAATRVPGASATAAAPAMGKAIQRSGAQRTCILVTTARAFRRHRASGRRWRMRTQPRRLTRTRPRVWASTARCVSQIPGGAHRNARAPKLAALATAGV